MGVRQCGGNITFSKAFGSLCALLGTIHIGEQCMRNKTASNPVEIIVKQGYAPARHPHAQYTVLLAVSMTVRVPV